MSHTEIDFEHFTRHQADCRRIAVVARQHNVMLTDEDTYRAWSAYSDSVAAGWMRLPNDDESWILVSDRAKPDLDSLLRALQP